MRCAPSCAGDCGGTLWNEYVARYHYLGYKTLVGAQMRYAVQASDGTPLAMLGFSTAAWTLAPRDRFIGWSRRHREKNLPLVVDNPRFLILPWIRIPNLGSHILALVRRQLPTDWTARYKTTPVLIETFVETPRYTGAVYRASGWIRVGATQGRGRYGANDRDKPKKDIWLRPLRKDWSAPSTAGRIRRHAPGRRNGYTNSQTGKTGPNWTFMDPGGLESSRGPERGIWLTAKLQKQPDLLPFFRNSSSTSGSRRCRRPARGSSCGRGGCSRPRRSGTWGPAM